MRCGWCCGCEASASGTSEGVLSSSAAEYNGGDQYWSTTGLALCGLVVEGRDMIEGLLGMPIHRTMRDFLVSATQVTIVFGALTLALLGLLLPTHDYAGMGDPILDRLVSRDALRFATIIAGSALTLSVISVALFRRRRLVWLGAFLALLSTVNLWRCVSYYWLHPDWIGN